MLAPSHPNVHVLLIRKQNVHVSLQRQINLWAEYIVAHTSRHHR
jgi:hypothetical protein